jgi:hypothetical protein
MSDVRRFPGGLSVYSRPLVGHLRRSLAPAVAASHKHDGTRLISGATDDGMLSGIALDNDLVVFLGREYNARMSSSQRQPPQTAEWPLKVIMVAARNAVGGPDLEEATTFHTLSVVVLPCVIRHDYLYHFQPRFYPGFGRWKRALGSMCSAILGILMLCFSGNARSRRRTN